jgi:aspartate/methionine/tyrosine aminotransferase
LIKPLKATSADARRNFYIHADVGHLTNDSIAFCEALLRDTGVAEAPGLDFDPVDGNGFIRLSFAFSTDLIEEAIRRMIPWFAARAPVAVAAPHFAERAGR